MNFGSVCGCITVGKSVISTEFEKTVYRPDDTPRAIVSVDNTRCKVDVRDVKFRMYREFKIKVGSLTYEVVDLNRFSETMIEKHHGGVPAMRKGQVATELNLSMCKLSGEPLVDCKTPPLNKLRTSTNGFAQFPEDQCS